MYDKESKEWSEQYNYQLQQMMSSQGDFRLALQEIGHCSDAALSALHLQFIKGDYHVIGVMVSAMINLEIMREADAATERYFDDQSTINGKI